MNKAKSFLKKQQKAIKQHNKLFNSNLVLSDIVIYKNGDKVQVSAFID